MEEPIEIDVDPQTGFDMILQAAFDNKTRTPESILHLISPASISVSSLLKSDLPTLLNSSTVNSQPTTSCMMKVPVRWNTGELLKVPVPPRKWLSDLEIDLKKQWPGVTSVQHPTISGLHLPLWAGNFWWCLVEAVECQEHGIFQTFSFLFYDFLLVLPPRIPFSQFHSSRKDNTRAIDPIMWPSTTYNYNGRPVSSVI